MLLVIPFWALVAYLVLPRLHTLLTGLYVPSYCIARTRTSDGLLGDPVNLALDGTAGQIHEAMTRGGWVLADDITARSSWGIIVSSVFGRSYPEAPVSPLKLFGRQQCLAYQQEVEGNAAQRHHVRFWRCPDGWLLPGGRRVQWLGAGTYDRAVGLSLFTFQVTHKIDADIDVERDYIVDSVLFHNHDATVSVIEDFSTDYHHRNGGGDEIRTDGDLPVLDLRSVEVPARSVDDLPFGVVRAARGYDDPAAESGIATGDPDRPADDVVPAVKDLPRPTAIVLACVLVAVSAQVRGAFSVRTVIDTAQQDSAAEGVDVGGGELALIIGLLLGVTYVVMGLAVLFTYLGHARARVLLMAVIVWGVATEEIGRVSDGTGGSGVWQYTGIAVDVLVLLALTTAPARDWSRRMTQERRERRLAGRRSRA